MGMLEKMAASTARGYEDQAAKATSAAKRDKLLRKATERWQEVQRLGGQVPPGRLPDPGPVGADAPTVRLPAVRPLHRDGQHPLPLPPQKKRRNPVMLIVAVVVLLGLFGWATEMSTPPDDEDSAAADDSRTVEMVPSGSPGDRAACADAREAFAVLSDGDLSSGDLTLMESTLLTGAERMQGVELKADDPEVASAGRAATLYLRDAADALNSQDVDRATEIVEESDAVFGRVVSACASVLVG